MFFMSMISFLFCSRYYDVDRTIITKLGTHAVPLHYVQDVNFGTLWSLAFQATISTSPLDRSAFFEKHFFSIHSSHIFSLVHISCTLHLWMSLSDYFSIVGQFRRSFCLYEMPVAFNFFFFSFHISVYRLRAVLFSSIRTSSFRVPPYLSSVSTFNFCASRVAQIDKRRM